MVFTLIGIPIMIVYLACTGQLLSKSFASLYERLRCSSTPPGDENSPHHEESVYKEDTADNEMMVIKGRSANYNNSLSRRHPNNVANHQQHMNSTTAHGQLWNPTYTMANGHLG